MAIQFRRGTAAKISASTEVPVAGQPVYDTTNNKLYVGDGSTQLKNLSAIGGSGSVVKLSGKYGTKMYPTCYTSTSADALSNLYLNTDIYINTDAKLYCNAGFMSGTTTYAGGSINRNGTTINLPSTAGTLALTSQIPTITYDTSTHILNISTT